MGILTNMCSMKSILKGGSIFVGPDLTSPLETLKTYILLLITKETSIDVQHYLVGGQLAL